MIGYRAVLLVFWLMMIYSPKKWGYTYLSDCEKRLLAKSLNFSLPPEYLDYADHFVNFELFYANILT